MAPAPWSAAKAMEKMLKSPTTNVSVITHRSTAPCAASALTVSATGSNRGCKLAASVHPPTIRTGAAAEETTPHQGTLRMPPP